jgi:hypothetical protein
LISATTGRGQLIKVLDVATGTVNTILKADGSPESVRWCEFASDTQLVCNYGGDVPFDGQFVGFSRLITMDVQGKSLKQLGARRNDRTFGLNQVDGKIIDWLPDNPGYVLMARNYLPEVQTGSVIQKQNGLGIDRIDLSTTRATRIEAPRPEADSYISDGRGQIRLMTTRRSATGF